MAAPIARRCFYSIQRHLLHKRASTTLFNCTNYATKKKVEDEIEIDAGYYHDYKVPYLPELEAQQSVHAKYPDIEVSAEEYKFVERLLPAKTIPAVKEHESYPTPSGWVPPNADLQPSDYGVRRTRNHMLPCYFKKRFDGGEVTVVKKIHGDIWKFREEAVTYLKNQGYKNVDSQVHEIGNFVRFRGNFHSHVADFLLQKGF